MLYELRLEPHAGSHRDEIAREVTKIASTLKHPVDVLFSCHWTRVHPEEAWNNVSVKLDRSLTEHTNDCTTCGGSGTGPERKRRG